MSYSLHVQTLIIYLLFAILYDYETYNSVIIDSWVPSSPAFQDQIKIIWYNWIKIHHFEIFLPYFEKQIKHYSIMI